MGFNTYPNNPFPPSTDRMDVDALEAEVNQLKNSLTNVDVALSVPDNSGKNLIPMTLAGIKSANTNGTWADNVYTVGGLTFTVLTDSDGNVIGVTANGTAPANDFYFVLGDISFVKDVSYRMTSGTTGSTATTYRIWAYSNTAFPVGHRLSTDENCGENVARDARENEKCDIAFMIMAGYVPDNVTVYPMVRLASVTDPTFAPYIPSVESRIEAVEADQMIKTSETVTLNSNGISRLSLTLSQGRIVYAVKVDGGNNAYLVLPYCTTVDGGVWAVKVVDPDDMSPIASAEVTIAYGYLP